MREIKFRFWSKILNNFVIPQDDIFIGALRDPNMEVMQYTGLKDKNGKEIYEGDIVDSDNHALGVVKWRHFGFEEDMINTTGWWVIQEEGKVVGNIYENPELLDN